MDGGRYRYCPVCRTEYRHGFRTCADCRTDLVDELPPEEAAPAPDTDLEALQSWVGTDPVAVLETTDGLEAQLARGLLVDAAIPCSVWSSGYYGSLGLRVMVHKDDYAEAREILAAQLAEGPDE
ncbi:MAG: DUF2007 domain-containing protein [Actinomycetota bacterium]|nr:DUF2007 domain-containing protein [Actinomycetota bacterium]